MQVKRRLGHQEINNYLTLVLIPHKHDNKKRLGSRKLHFLIDQDGFIQANIVTSEKTSDGSQVRNLVETTL